MNTRDLFLSALATYLVQAYVAVFFLYPVALQMEGVSLALVGSLLGVFFGATTVGRPVGGALVERWGVRWALIVASGGLVVVTTPLLWVRALVPLLALRVGMGLFYGVAMVAVTAYQTAAIPPEKRGSAFAWIAVAYVLPQITVMPLGDYFLARHLPWEYLTLAPLTAVGCLVASLATVDLPTSARPRDERWGSWKELLELKALPFMLGSSALFALVNSSTLQYLSAAVSEKGLSPSAFFVANALSALGMRILGSRVLDRFPRGVISGLMSTLMGGLLCLLPLVTSHGALAALGLLYGVGMGFGFPVQLALAPDFVSPRLLPKGVAAIFFVMDLGWIVTAVGAALLGTWLGVQGTLEWVGVVGLVGGMAVTWAAVRLYRERARSRA